MPASMWIWCVWLSAVISLAGAAHGEPIARGYRVDDLKVKPPPRTIWIEVREAGQPLRRAALEVIDQQSGEMSRVQTDQAGKGKLVVKAGVPYAGVLTQEGYMIQSVTNMTDGNCYRFDVAKKGPSDGWKSLRQLYGTSELIPGVGAFEIRGSWSSSNGQGPVLTALDGFTVEGLFGRSQYEAGKYCIYEGELYTAVKGAQRRRFGFYTVRPGQLCLIYKVDAR